MLCAERRNEIKQLATIHKRVETLDLCKRFNTSMVTIRKDLAFLEEAGHLTRVHGGAILSQSIISELSISEKEQIRSKEKERIARAAESLINNGDVIILDSGFTAVYIAKLLKLRSGLKIITSGLNVANELVGSDNELIITGGIFRKETFGMVGGFPESVMSKIVADKLFLGVEGIDFSFGLTTHNLAEAKLNSMMIQAAQEVILITDSSKFGRKTMCVIGKLRDVDRIITDKKIKPAYLKRLKTMDLRVDVV